MPRPPAPNAFLDKMHQGTVLFLVGTTLYLGVEIMRASWHLQKNKYEARAAAQRVRLTARELLGGAPGAIPRAWGCLWARVVVAWSVMHPRHLRLLQGIAACAVLMAGMCHRKRRLSGLNAWVHCIPLSQAVEQQPATEGGQ